MNKTRCAREWELVKKETKNKCCLTFYWIQNCFLIRAVCTTVHACLFSSRFCQPDAVTAVVFRQHAGKSRSRCLQNTHLEARTLHWDIGTAAAAVASALCELPHFSYSQFRVLNITIFRVLFGVEHQRQRQRPKKNRKLCNICSHDEFHFQTHVRRARLFCRWRRVMSLPGYSRFRIKIWMLAARAHCGKHRTKRKLHSNTMPTFTEKIK